MPPQNCLMSTAKCRWRAFGDTGQLPPQPALAHQKRSVTRRGLSLDEVRTRSTLLLRLRSGPREPCFSHSPRLCPVRGCAGNKQHKETQTTKTKTNTTETTTINGLNLSWVEIEYIYNSEIKIGFLWKGCLALGVSKRNGVVFLTTIDSKFIKKSEAFLSKFD